MKTSDIMHAMEKDAIERAKRRLRAALQHNNPDIDDNVKIIASDLCAELIEIDVLFGRAHDKPIIGMMGAL